MCLLEMTRLVVRKKRNRVIDVDLRCQKLTASSGVFGYSNREKACALSFFDLRAASVCAVITTVLI